MTPALVTIIGAALLVAAAGLVDYRLGLAVCGVLLVAAGLFIDFEDGS